MVMLIILLFVSSCYCPVILITGLISCFTILFFLYTCINLLFVMAVLGMRFYYANSLVKI
jgi:hypothetical protein